jgi:AcrR family transcriptional regulator
MSAEARARVVAAAGDIADAEGLDAVTLSRVAAAVGTRPPSLYNHIEGRDGLMHEPAAESVDELGAAITGAAVGRSREDALRAVAVAFRAYARERPGRYAATVRAPAPGDTEAIEAAATAVSPIVAILAGWSIEGDEAVHLVRVIRSAIHGFVSIEAGGGFDLPPDLDVSFTLLVDSLVAAITAAAPEPPG